MILGNVCTRSCGFCGVKPEDQETVWLGRTRKVARSIKIMNIKHAVVTSVDRDDLMAGLLWIETVKAIRKNEPLPKRW
jgi:lipoic acid synthetase